MDTCSDLVTLVNSFYADMDKIDGYDFTVHDIVEALGDSGIPLYHSSLYRQLKALKCHKNARGYYSAPDVAVVLLWNAKGRHNFSSFGQFLEAEGEQLRSEIARSRDAHVTI